MSRPASTPHNGSGAAIGMLGRLREELRDLPPHQRLLRLGGCLRKAAGVAALIISRAALFNPISLRLWVRALRGRVEFFGSSHTLGDMLAIDFYLKRKQRLNSTALSIFLVNKSHVANRYLARFLARALGGRRTWIVLSRFLCRLLTPLERELFFAGPRASFTQHPQEWHELNRQIVYHLERALPETERRRVRQVMAREAGLPLAAAFVCVHAREDAFKARYQPARHNSYREIDIATYLPAIEYVTRRGFWVVRMGEPTVKPLPALPQVIDYARSPLKSDAFDIVLMAECEYLIGCNSGFSQLAHLFNKRALWTNSIPIDMGGSWDDLVLWIPKLLYDLRQGRYLTYQEVIRRGIGKFHRTEQYVAAEVEPHGNSAEDILAAAQELDRWCAGTLDYSEQERAAQAAFLRLIPPDYQTYGTRSAICASFIRAHRDLTPAPAACEPTGSWATGEEHPAAAATSVRRTR